MSSAAVSSSRSLPWSADHFLQTGVTIPPDGYALLRGVRRHLRRRARRSARARQPPRARHPARHALRARPLRQLSPGDAASTSGSCPLKGRTRDDVDFVVVPREHRRALRRHRRPVQGGNATTRVAIQEDLNTRKGVERIIRDAFEYAKAHGRRSVCMADKSNAMRTRTSCGSASSTRSPRSIPDIEARHLYVDALALLLVQDPCAVRGDRHQQPVRRHRHRPRRRRSRAASAWPRPATCIRAGRRCSSRCTARRRRSPARTSPTRSGAILSAAMMLEHLGLREEAAGDRGGGAAGGGRRSGHG